MSESQRSILGLDIGGANLKAAHSDGSARSLSFPLWKEPKALAEELRRFVASMPRADEVALTMTGELCDCFASQAEGVRSILASVAQALGSVPVRVFSLEGRFVTAEEARLTPARVAAANWLAQATLAARLVSNQAALLLDMGSTTTDIVPLVDGKPRPTALPDPERMEAGELIYTGARRTPVCAVLGVEVAAEFFATMADVYLTLGELTEQPENRDTADGRPQTKECAHARLARMLCADPATYPREKTRGLARRARTQQMDDLRRAVRKVAASLPRPLEAVILSGSGAFVLRHLELGVTCRDLSVEWGEARTTCACAWAVAQLASEEA